MKALLKKVTALTIGAIESVEDAILGIQIGFTLGAKAGEIYAAIICFMSDEGMTRTDIKARFQEGSDWPKDANGNFLGENKARDASISGRQWNRFQEYLSRVEADAAGVPVVEIVAGEEVPKKKKKAEKPTGGATGEPAKKEEQVVKFDKAAQLNLLRAMLAEYREDAEIVTLLSTLVEKLDKK